MCKGMGEHGVGQVAAAVAGVLLLLSARAQAEVRLPKMLTSHGVLQRDRPIHLWGWSDPGACLQLSLHQQNVKTCADTLGMWSTYLAPESAGGPYTLTVTETGSNVGKVVVDDLLIGDVWFASGQSNMEMPLKGFGADTPVKDGVKEIAAATHPTIRLLRFEHAASGFPLDEVKSAWTECTPATAQAFSAVAYFFGREIAEKEKVPVGLIDATWGGTPIESWISLETIGSDASLMPLFHNRAKFIAKQANYALQQAADKREDAAAMAAGRPKPRRQWHPGDLDAWNPSYLYNGMIAPATAYTVRGFLWYQGESNSNPEWAPLYTREMKALIEDWRGAWGEGELPFLYVQIASFDSPLEDWGQLRDAQRRALSEANTAMAVSLDVGTPNNVHPPDKQTVGHRLALGARALAYGERLEWSGPTLRAVGRTTDGVQVWFDHADGLTASRPVSGFELAGEDGQFHPAQATIVGQSVQVRSDAVAKPTQLRYGWANVTDARLANRSGLPASTFAVTF